MVLYFVGIHSPADFNSLFYPCQCFSRFLNSYHLQRKALQTFMDAFQGCYKDGTNGTKDCRYFSALYPIARVVAFISLRFDFVSPRSSAIVLIFLILLLVSCCHPYKKQVGYVPFL